jgi:thiol-disulfide isomerase/thioredoxin
MSRKLLIVVAIIGLATIGGIAYLITQNDGDAPSITNGDTAANTDTQQQTPADPMATGTYVDYSEEALANADGTRVIFFHAPWCPQCVALEADILDKGVPEDVTILKADYDSSQQLRQKYEVTIQTTLVKVNQNGDMIDKFVAYSEPTLEALKQNLLE